MKNDDPKKYNQLLGNMILMYYEVGVAKDMLNKSVPDIYRDDDIEILEELLNSVDDYSDLSNTEISDNYIIFILLLATISHNNLRASEKDKVTIEGKKGYPNLYKKFNPNDRIDDIVIEMKENISFEEFFENPILETFLKLKQANCSYDLAVKYINDYFSKYVRLFDRKQYEIGMRGIITKYYVFEKSLLELGNELNLRDQAIINYIDDENNSYGDILELVSQGINRKYLIRGYITASLYTNPHFNNQLDSIDKKNGFSTQMKKRFNN